MNRKKKKNISRSLPEDTEIDNYNIIRKLGQGNFGITYPAKEKSSGKEVVIKENFPRDYAIRNQKDWHIIPDDEENNENFQWSRKNFHNGGGIMRGLSVNVLHVYASVRFSLLLSIVNARVCE